MSFIDKLLGNTGESKIKKIRPLIAKINALEPSYQALSDSELREKTNEFKNRYNNGETLDSLLVEAFAAAREAAVRTVGMRPFDVQLLGGIVLHQGRIAEMKTGEGKTLVAVLPAYLNAIAGKGVYVVTSNDYLASRDAQWMGKIHRFLGLSVGCVTHNPYPSPNEGAMKRAAYGCDITYGSHSEIGFDYLRDNMAIFKQQLVQRDYFFAIVDEVDSILIDEAKTPLIISGRGEGTTDMYINAEKFVSRLSNGGDLQELCKQEGSLMNIATGAADEVTEKGDFMVDLKARSVILTQVGIEKAERFFNVENLSSPDLSELNNYIHQALKAHALFEKDRDYVVADDQVVIVDEYTGRLMHGRRYSDGLHQALEAKENAINPHVKVRNEDQTLASITYQNLFRLFPKLSGMTGTAKTEEDEFMDIYDLDVVEIPTNKPSIRSDLNDLFYRTIDDKFSAIAKEAAKIHETGQPILIGTASVTMSEKLSRILSRNGLKHDVLNAKNHAKEAQIIAQAGQLGHITVATNMAGRGTDILLGGNPDFMARRDLINAGMDDALVEEATSHSDTEDSAILTAREQYNTLYKKYKEITDKEHAEVVEVGGLYILGTERHDARRIDNQLRGRSGRQGDPGTTRFFISAEDDVIHRFGADKMTTLLAMFSQDDDGTALDSKIITKAVETIQRRVEANNYAIRKHVLDYDDVMNKMRELIYTQRRGVLMGEDVHDKIMDMIDEAVTVRVNTYCSPHAKESDWDLASLSVSMNELFKFRPKSIKGAKKHKELLENLKKEVFERYDEIDKELTDYTEAHPDVARNLRFEERTHLLFAVNRHWAMHIDAMDSLRDGIGLRAIGQSDPVVAYRNEGFAMFDDMVANIRESVVGAVFGTTTKTQRVYNKKAPTLSKKDIAAKKQQLAERNKDKITVMQDKIQTEPGRNDKCPCGSGKKYKHCCGADKEEK